MNCASHFVQRVSEKPEHPALWDPFTGFTSFQDLHLLSQRAQALLIRNGVQEGDAVLLFAQPSPELYALVLALLGLGAHALFVEPWLSLAEIDAIIAESNPKAFFFAGWVGRLFGWRCRSIRRIPRWIAIRQLAKEPLPSRSLQMQPVHEEAPAILTFTTGTTGSSKRVVRTQGTLQNQLRILSNILPESSFELCVLPNFALLNLARGTCSYLIDGGWNPKTLQKISKQPLGKQPVSVTCGTGFLETLLDHSSLFPSLRSFHVGGALCDLHLYERGFAAWPRAAWIQIYGSSEAEPVAYADAREVVRKSRARGYRQTLFLGKPVPGLCTKIEPDSLWVAGPHVTLNKKGSSWHRMGDRIIEDAEGLWYQGRSQQPHHHFLLEQRIYRMMGSCNAFVAWNREGKLFLFGEGVKEKEKQILKLFPEIHATIEGKILRDRRHRARMNRKESLQKGAPWLVG